MTVELIELSRIVADGYHNAFTDLAFWRGHTYLCYRSAQSRGIDPPGNVVVCRSRELSTWEQVAVFDTGADDRDHRSVPGRGSSTRRIYILWGTGRPQRASYHRMGDRRNHRETPAHGA